MSKSLFNYRMDKHNRVHKLKRALERLDASCICKENKAIIKQFEGYLLQEEYSTGRRQKYVEQLTKIAGWLDKPFKKASKQDIIGIMVKVGNHRTDTVLIFNMLNLV